MSNTIKIVAAVAMGLAAVAAPKLATVDLGKLIQNKPAATPGEVVIDHALQLRLVCAGMAANLPDNESINSTNKLIDYLDTAFSTAFLGTASPVAIGEIREKIGNELEFSDTSKPITQAERVKAADILTTYTKAPVDG